VKHEQSIDCGGGYIKILPNGLDQENFNGESEYNLMFGPDICGATKKVHFIITHKGKNHLIKSDVRAESDELTHLYTLIINADQSFQILIDNKEVKKGTLLDSFDILPAKEINDLQSPNLLTGLMRKKSLIPKPKNLRIGTLPLPPSKILRLNNPRTGTLNSTVNGKLPPSLTLNTRVNGRQPRSPTLLTKESGSTPKSLTPSTKKIMRSTLSPATNMSVLKSGK